MYRGGAPLVDVRGRVVLVVDDGLATGVSARAAIKALKVWFDAVCVAVCVHPENAKRDKGLITD